MKKIEIIANLSVEADVMDALEKSGVKGFTKIPVVHGAGNSNPKKGDSIWPEENFMLIICIEENKVAVVKNKIKDLKEKFPNEGIKYYLTEVLESL
jgi:nitrogen regulatory protein PII